MPMRYFALIVKGKPDVAVMAAHKHNLVCRIIGETHNATVLRVDDEFDGPSSTLQVIRTWYHDRRTIEPEHGFPDGTCLLFTEHRD